MIPQQCNPIQSSHLYLACAAICGAFHALPAEEMHEFGRLPNSNALWLGTYTVTPGTTVKNGPYEQWWIKRDWWLIVGTNITVEEVFEHDLLVAIREKGNYADDQLHGDRHVYGYDGGGANNYGTDFIQTSLFDEQWSNGEMVGYYRKSWHPDTMDLDWESTMRAYADYFQTISYSPVHSGAPDHSIWSEVKIYNDGRDWRHTKMTHNATGTLVEDSYYYYVPGVTTTTSTAPYQRYWYTNGQLKTSREYNDSNQRHGVHESYKEDGTPTSYATYRNDLLHGRYVRYYSNGNIDDQFEYQYGLKHGPASSYRSDGQIESHGNYSNNTVCGIWTYYTYDASGAVINVVTNDKGPCGTLAIEEEEVFEEEIDPETVHFISGMLRSRDDGMPVVGATVSSDRGPSTTTGNQGDYSLDLGSDAQHRITVSHPSYYSVNTQVDLSSSQKRILNGTMRRKLETDSPVVTGIQSTGGSVFFEGLSAQNTYTVSIDWQTATPKEILINRNGSTETLSTTAGTASVSYTMDTMFKKGTSDSANSLSFQAVDAVGFRSNTETLHPRVVPVPAWLQSLGQFAQAVHAGNVYTYKLTASWPQEPLDLQISPDTLGSIGWNAWSLVPLVGGQNFGLKSTQAVLEGELKTDGTGGVYFGGQTGFAAAGQSITGKVGGKGYFDMPANRGIEWAKGALLLSLEGQIEKEVGPVELIPALGNAVNWPVVGGPLRWFNSTAKFQGTILSGFDLELDLMARDALSFSRSEGAIRAGVTIGLESDFSKNLKLGFSGGGEIKAVFHIPAEPEVVKSVSAEIYARLNVSVFMFSSDFTASHTFEYPGSNASMAIEPFVWSEVSGFRPIDTGFARSASYFSISDGKGMAPASLLEPGTVVESVSSFADPTGVSGSSGNRVATVFIDGNRPTLQSSEIQLLSFFNPNSVTALRLTDDTHADLEPTIAQSFSSTFLAWSRVRDPAFPEDGELEDMAAAMEVVLQTVDGSGNPSERLQLSDNDWMDHSPQLLEADTGVHLLFWQSNEGNLMLGTQSFPTRVHYLNVTFNPSKDAVETIPYAFINCPQIAYTVDYQRNPSVLFEKDEDGDPATLNDRRLMYLRMVSGTWQQPQIISEAGSNFGAFAAVRTYQGISLLWVAEDGLHIYPIDNPSEQLVLALPDDVAITSLQNCPADASRFTIVATQPVETTSGSSVFLYGYNQSSQNWHGPAELTFDGELISNVSLSAYSQGWVDIHYLSYPSTDSDALPDLRHKAWTFESRVAVLQPSVTVARDVESGELVITGMVYNRDFNPADGHTVRLYKNELGVDSPTALNTVALSKLEGGAKLPFELRLSTDNPASNGALMIAVAPSHTGSLSRIPDYSRAILPGREVPWDIEVLAARMEQLSSTRTAVTAAMLNRGPDNAREVSVAMLVDGKELQRRSVAGIYAGKQREVGFEFSPADDLLHPVALIEVVVDPDAQAIDTQPLNNRTGFRTVHPGLWGQAAIDNGSAVLAGFGNFSVSNDGTANHPTEGWVYPVGRNWNNVYFFDYQRGLWWWSASDLYPWRYYPHDQSWRRD